MDSLMRRRGAGVVVVVGIAGLMTGCAGAQSTMSITYDDDGDEHTVTAAFDDITCSDVKVGGTEVDPVNASITVRYGQTHDDDRVTAWIVPDSLVVFEATGVSVTREGSRVSVVGQGDVQVAQRLRDAQEASPSDGFDTDAATTTSGTLTAELTCAN